MIRQTECFTRFVLENGKKFNQISNDYLYLLFYLLFTLDSANLVFLRKLR
jgi:hypothetical protein